MQVWGQGNDGAEDLLGLFFLVSTQEHHLEWCHLQWSEPSCIDHKKGNSPQTCPYASPVEVTPQQRWPSFQMTLCRAGKYQAAQLFFLVDTVLFTPGIIVVFLTLVDYMPGSCPQLRKSQTSPNVAECVQGKLSQGGISCPGRKVFFGDIEQPLVSYASFSPVTKWVW